MKIIFGIFLFGFLFFASTSYINAQVVINELNSYEESGDWVELYAIETTDISGWILRDSATSIVETIPAGVTVVSNQFYVIEVGNRLNRTNDHIKLLKADDTTLIDQMPYGGSNQVCAPGSGQSVGRYPNANNTIDRFSTPTKSSSNNSATLLACPTPTPSLTASPSPTPTPTKTSSPTPTPTKTPTSKPTTKPTAKPTSPPAGGSTEEPVVLTTSTEEPEASDAPEVEEPENKFPVLAIPLMGIGAGFVGVAAYPIIKNKFRRV